MRVPGRTGGHKPGIAEHIRVLQHQLQRPIPGISPERLREPKRRLMNRPVLAVGGAGVTIADRLAGGVYGQVFPDEGGSIVRVEERVLACSSNPSTVEPE